MPALAMNIYGISILRPKNQLYYIVVDSLILMMIALALIVISLA